MARTFGMGSTFGAKLDEFTVRALNTPPSPAPPCTV
jgi:hypothetical protein